MGITNRDLYFFQVVRAGNPVVTRIVLPIQHSTITTELNTALDVWVLLAQDGVGRIRRCPVFRAPH